MPVIQADLRLWIDGLVAQPLKLDLTVLGTLPKVSIRQNFRCKEGWSVEDLDWRSFRLADLLVVRFTYQL